jgi:hypothetical protein
VARFRLGKSRPPRPPKLREAKKPRIRPALHGLRGGVPLTPLFAVAAVLIYAVSKDEQHGATFWSVLAVGLATAGAALLAGVLLGFLFGLPRVAVGARGNTEGKDSSGLETNSNLDEVSDWLTKILVGLGLVQLGRISSAVGEIGRELAPGLGGVPGAKGFAIGLLIYSAIDGFLIGYIWTRVDLSRVFQGAHERLRNPVVEEGVRATDEVLEEASNVLSTPLREISTKTDTSSKP